MQILSEPYRWNPPDGRCFYENEDTMLYNRLHHRLYQQNLHLRRYASEQEDLLSVLMVCRTLALPGSWSRRVNPDFLTVTYVHSGETLVRINEQSFVAEAGDLILMPPGTDYEFGTRKKAVRSAIVVQGSMVEVILRNLHGKYIFPALSAEFAEEKIERFFTNEDADEHQLAVWSFDLLSALKSNETFLPVPELLQKVLQKMKKHLDRPLTLEVLAGEAGVSERTLSRIFQKYLQISPHQYLVRLRMKRACQMLASEEFSIKEIAMLAGYPNALNFSTEFRRMTGCSPTQFRTQKNHDEVMRKLETQPELHRPHRDMVI